MGTEMARQAQVEGVLADRTVAFLMGAEGAAQDEALHPWAAVRAAGGRAVLVHPDEDEAGLFEAFGGGGEPPLERGLSEVHVDDYDALVLCGSHETDDPLLQEPAAIALVTAFFLARKPIAALCRAPGLLVRAGLVDERMLTSWPGLAEEITAAGGLWHDCPVVVCRCGPNVLVTGRGPEDVAEFCRVLVDQIAHGEHAADEGRD
ncbi:DJ-1/PfpI family protein [Actinospica sp. MGRD01-02]|uniref:DJ-1/PfpI family protein n=1 Tax=Actinospica acidithermotolerans TaxID=2828514 RepID=A0A941IPH2_9ACTN|nr:DJ-1/PfpI family protein [Actinospica acidithermotolerans]MBR7830426.1 DJ-1/PfpI family protein [Actinospica acidithermotolerans]